jgi:hypothetical protein
MDQFYAGKGEKLRSLKLRVVSTPERLIQGLLPSARRTMRLITSPFGERLLPLQFREI